MVKVLFRADASTRIGTGHVMRCLTLARALRGLGAECAFIGREHPGNLFDFLEEEGFTTYRLPVKQFILNNERLGMVRQWQELLHGERYSHSWSEALPDFVKLAEAFGAKGIICKDPKDLDDAIMEMLEYDGPVIFDCLVEKHENCFPMIPSGKAHNEMLLGAAETQGVIQSGGAVLV